MLYRRANHAASELMGGPDNEPAPHSSQYSSPCAAYTSGEIASLLVPLSCMCRVHFWRNCLDDDRHETMQGPAKLRALSVEDPLPLNEGGDAVQTTRCAIRFHTEGKDCEVVEHILSCTKKSDVCTSW